MKKILLLFISLGFTSCATFTSKEKAVIYSEPGKSARVTLITNPQDSVVLRTPSKDIRKIKNNKDLAALIEIMKKTMEVENGVGIAAPQIGINKNIFLFLRLDKPNTPVQVAINPKILSHPSETTCFLYDGCLSVPDRYGNSQRYSWIEVEYKNEKGETIREKLLGGGRKEDYTGVIFQHEFDHINGKLYIDKLCNE